MKKLKLLATSLILVLPFLMANSPAPYPQPTDYEDYTATAIVEGGNGINVWTYTTTFTNNGDGYVPLDRILLANGDEQYGYGPLDVPGMYLRKNETRELNWRFSSKVEVPKLLVSALLNPDTKASYTLEGTITKTESTSHSDELNKPIFLYTYSAEVTGLKASTYYGVITSYTYNGETYHGSYSKNQYGFYSDIDMDVSAIQITKVSFFEGRVSALSGLMRTLVNIFLLVGAIFLLIILIPIIIIIVVLARRKKKTA